jgi:DNA-directed RNA polymerase sigma subunit (sigma70/sigma32)
MRGIDHSSTNASLPTTSLNKSRTSHRKKQQLQQRRLSVEEQQELFRHVMEVRRIRNIEIELLNVYEQQEQEQFVVEPILLQQQQQQYSSTNQISTKVTSLELAQNTGYGKNLQEFKTALILGQQAREQLITTNMGLVHYCINDILQHHTLRTITIDDLIQEGAIGLSRAVDRYNPSFYQQQQSSADAPSSSAITTTSSTPSSSSSSILTNAKFSTYAVYWIRAAILRTIRERDDIMRVPDHVTTAIRKISNVAHTFGISLDNTNKVHNDENVIPASFAGSKENDDDIESEVLSSSTYWLNNDNDPYQQENIKQMIVDQTGYTDQLVHNAMMVRNRRNKYGTTVLSFESWMQQGKHYETDIIPSQDQDSSSSYYEETSQNGSIEHIKQILSRFLRPKEMEALSWRYGLNDIQQHNTPITHRIGDSNPLAKRNYLAETEMELYGSTTTNAAPKNRNIPISPTLTNKPKDDIVKGKWGEAMSFYDVGKQMQISAEYGRRLCHGALHKLRCAVAEGRLEPAILM